MAKKIQKKSAKSAADQFLGTNGKTPKKTNFRIPGSRRLSTADLEMIASGQMKDPRPAPKDPAMDEVDIKTGIAHLHGTPLSKALLNLAKKNVGSRLGYATPTAFHRAYQIEHARLKEKYSLDKELSESVLDRFGGPDASKYRPEFAEAARIVCSVYGSTQDELARFFRVTADVIAHWLRVHPEFSKAVYDRSSETNMKIMKRLARRAQGFHMDTEKIFFDVKRGQVVRAKTQDYFPPSESAIFFWLKNRMPEHWKDIKDVNVDEKRKVVLELYKSFDTMTQEQASDAYQELLKISPTTEERPRGPISDVPFAERDPKDGGTKPEADPKDRGT
jgi:hypothetical protein